MAGSGHKPGHCVPCSACTGSTSRGRPELVALLHDALRWRKSSHSSASGQCVEVAYLGSYVAVRDSKNPAR